MKPIKVRVKAKTPTSEEIFRYGECKAYTNLQSITGKLFTVCVLRYKGKNYFIEKADEKIIECVEV